MRYITDKEIAERDPKRHKELLEYSRDVLSKKEPELYKKYKDIYCLVCHIPREIPFSRYCKKHYKLYNEKQRSDIRSGRSRRPNYAYSEPGFNEGMNAWVEDKYHYRELLDRFHREESLQSIG
jgi:hypothetical protein